MNKKLLSVFLSGSIITLGFCFPVMANEEEDIEAYQCPIYRLYNPNSGEHFYTDEKEEKDYLSSIGWKYEGIGWYAPGYKYLYDAEPGFDPFVYRLYNPNSGEHHYTEDTNERSVLMRIGWKSEKICWYSEDKTKKVPVYRVYNPNKNVGAHHYTTEISERNTLVSNGWKDEGIAWYAIQKGELIPYAPEPTPSIPPQVNYSELYRSILDEAKRIVNSKGMADPYRAELYGLKEGSWVGTLDDFGFIIQDFSGDGVPELAIVDIRYNENILAFYTLVNNEPFNVFYSWSRSRNYYAGGSEFISEGSGGADSYLVETFSVSQDGKTIVNKTNSPNPSQTLSQRKNIGNLTPLSQWK